MMAKQQLVSEKAEEIVLVLGYPASGKTSLVSQFNGYTRLNRDNVGGKLSKLADRLQERITAGARSFVLDNTFPTAQSRKPFIDVAERNNLPIRCFWLNTSIEDSQFNASMRMVQKYGRILDLPEIEENSKTDPNCFPSAPLFVYRKQFEEPTTAEGFSEVRKVRFKREWAPEYKNRALILDYDCTLRDTKSGGKYPENLDDIVILPRRKKVLEQYHEMGYILAGVSNQSWIGKGILTWDQVNEGLQYTNDLLGFDIDFRFCAHRVPPIMCHCRKPQTGLGVELIEMYKLNPAECIYVGDRTTDKTFAKRCGFKFVHADDFFGA
jgi:HAD superfamily hydrolase (TIGR01662 family)